MNQSDLPEGATPLDADAIAGLIPRGIVHRGDLDEFEQRNIASAILWARGNRAMRTNVLSDHNLRLLHRRMFNQTWRWAGKYREADTNIGVAWYQVSTHVVNLCADVRMQIEQDVYPWDELAARFHHRLVLMHPFPNGNGRHARLATDLLLAQFDQMPFTWGAATFQRADLSAEGEVRREYLAALREADGGNIVRLLGFVRS